MNKIQRFHKTVEMDLLFSDSEVNGEYSNTANNKV